MIELPLLLVLTHIATAVFGIGGCVMFINRKKIKIPLISNFLPESPKQNPKELGLVVEDITVSKMSSEQYLTHLKQKYSKAWQDYKNYMSKRDLHHYADSYLMRLVLQIESGELKITKCTSHVMKISNGDEIWIANQYYGYGNLYTSPNRPDCVFSSISNKISPDTFMRIVDLEYNYKNPESFLDQPVIEIV